MAIFSFMIKTEAYAVQIYDGGVESIISDMQALGATKGISVWGKEYYTYQGVKRCEVHFGNTDENLVRFRLNNDGSVSRILIVTPSEYEQLQKAGYMLGSCLLRVGLNQSEMEKLVSDYIDGCLNVAINNPYATHMHEKYSVWCSATQRQIVLDVEMTFQKMELYLYAYK